MAEVFEEIKQRCEMAGLKFDEEEGLPQEGISNELWIEFPRGRGTMTVCAFDDTAHLFTAEHFEAYKGISEFGASWSPEYQVIECGLVEGASETPLYFADTYGDKYRAKEVLQLLGLDIDDEKLLDPSDRVYFDTDLELEISIGPCSNVHSLLCYSNDLEGWERDGFFRALSLQIKGIRAETHDVAAEILERVGNSVLFQIDRALGLTFTLERDSYRKPSDLYTNTDNSNYLLPPIRFEYDREAMSLYWYAKRAVGMPLLQFLAFYQVLEFYFPVYSEEEALRTLRTILKDPTFNPMRNADVAKLLEAVRVNAGGRAFGNEVSQLEATVRHCVTADDLRKFLISENEERYGFYTSDKSKKIVRKKIPIREKSEDHRGVAAERLYSIRNRIVHTKSGFDEEPLFPFDPESKYLHYDVELIEFLARKVLIASSRPLQI